MFEPERYELHASPAYKFQVDRRDFLSLLGGGILLLLALPVDAQRRGPAQPQDLAAWLHISEGGRVTVFTGKAELGQNIRTSLTQAVAEELHCRIDQIEMVMGDTALTPYDMGTFGSLTTPQMAPQLRRVAAAAREMLLDLAAQKWALDRTGISIIDGTLRAGNQSASFGELTHGQKLTQTVAADLKLTPAAEWKIAGKSLRKVNAHSIVTGKEKYVSDMKLPGMLYGRVVRAPGFNATLRSVDLKAAQAMPGVFAVQDGQFVGVAVTDPAKLNAAVAAVKAEWELKPGQANAKNVFEHLKANVEKVPAWKPLEGATKAESAYTVDYIAHTPLEPRAAVAQWEGDKLNVWTGSQRPFGVRGELAEAFGIPEDKIRVQIPATGSAYGGKHTGECAVEAARLAKAAGKPVKLVWTREEEFTWAYFRPAGLIEIKSAADASGIITSWQFHNYNSGNAAIRSPYNVPGQISEFHLTDSPLRQGSYRALAACANHFARECHMDELAHAAGLNPAAFRDKNATDPRLRAVIAAATEKFRWGQSKTRQGQGFGMMAGFDKGDYIACCVEVTVTNKKIKVERIVQAFECGAVVNPDQLKNLVVGSIVQGLGGALTESIDFEDGRILNPKLSAYRVPRFRDVPEIEVVLLDRKDLPSAGAGETAIVGIAPSIGNAVFDAVGVRLRALPLKLA